MQSKILVAAMAMLLSLNTFAQSPASGTINGHEYVDLGLSVKWATCNIGAEKPEDYGDYFAWGEAETKSEYTQENSTAYGKENYNFDDAARTKWGKKWRLPTKEELNEIVEKCTWQLAIVGEHDGCIITSKKNGNSIFLPAAGNCLGKGNDNAGKCGLYWSSSIFAHTGSYSLFFDCTSLPNPDVNMYLREYGLSIRAVSK